jgi:hypothetical protein
MSDDNDGTGLLVPDLDRNSPSTENGGSGESV